MVWFGGVTLLKTIIEVEGSVDRCVSFCYRWLVCLIVCSLGLHKLFRSCLSCQPSYATNIRFIPPGRRLGVIDAPCRMKSPTYDFLMIEWVFYWYRRRETLASIPLIPRVVEHRYLIFLFVLSTVVLGSSICTNPS